MLEGVSPTEPISSVYSKWGCVMLNRIVFQTTALALGLSFLFAHSASATVVATATAEAGVELLSVDVVSGIGPATVSATFVFLDTSLDSAEALFGDASPSSNSTATPSLGDSLLDGPAFSTAFATVEVGTSSLGLAFSSPFLVFELQNLSDANSVALNFEMSFNLATSVSTLDSPFAGNSARAAARVLDQNFNFLTEQLITSEARSDIFNSSALGVAPFSIELGPLETQPFALELVANAFASDITPLPEPSSFALMLGGLCGFGFLAIRRRFAPSPI